MKKTNTGFSLIELMVTIGIIAVLTAIITTNFTTAKARSRDAKRISDLAQLNLSLELFFDRCNSYPTPTTSGVLTTALTSTSCSGVTFGNYITRIPTAPNPGEVYVYAVNSVSPPPTDYVLKAVLETTTTALSEVNHINYPSFSPATDCSAELAYCIKPK